MKPENLIKYEVRIEVDLYANGEEDAHNLIRAMREAVFGVRGADAISTHIRSPQFKEVI